MAGNNSGIDVRVEYNIHVPIINVINHNRFSCLLEYKQQQKRKHTNRLFYHRKQKFQKYVNEKEKTQI